MKSKSNVVMKKKKGAAPLKPTMIYHLPGRMTTNCAMANKVMRSRMQARTRKVMMERMVPVQYEEEGGFTGTLDDDEWRTK